MLLLYWMSGSVNEETSTPSRAKAFPSDLAEVSSGNAWTRSWPFAPASIAWRRNSRISGENSTWSIESSEAAVGSRRSTSTSRSLGVCAVVLGAVAVSHGAGARGAALDVSSAPIPVTAAEQARPSSPTMSVASVNQTDPTQFSGKVVRHPETQNVIATLAARARKGQAAAVQFLLGNDLKFQSWGHSYHTGEARRINIGQAPKDGVVRGTAVLHPSGHSDAVAEFARSNTYTVRVELPDGRVLERSGIPRNVVSDGKLPADTPEYSTAIDIAYPYQSGVTKVAAWPDGSAGVAGYVEGRLYYVHSHDAPWDVDAQQRKSEAHRLAHPQVRWGTPHERSDRKKHGVSPDPRAYRHYSND